MAGLVAAREGGRRYDPAMRILTTGVDGSGRSCVVDVRDVTVDPTAMQRPQLDVAYPTTALPLPTRPPGAAPLLDLGVPVEHCKWDIATFPANWSAPMHHTDTIDFDTVLAGQVALVLDDGDHELAPGDVVLITGVDHAWRSGPEGATLSIVVQGTVPPVDA